MSMAAYCMKTIRMAFGAPGRRSAAARLAGLTLAFGAWSAATAAPPSGPAAVDRFLQGIWSTNCSAAPRQGAGLALFLHLPGDDRLFLQTIGQSEGRLVTTMTQVFIDRTNPDGTAVVRYDHGGGRVNTTVMDLSDPSAFTVVSSTNETGTYTTRDGWLVRTGQRQPAYRRC